MKVILVLLEGWTLHSPRDLRGLVRLAQEAEPAGVDAVMLSDHLVLGASAGDEGRPENPREYAAPGNRDRRRRGRTRGADERIAAATSHCAGGRRDHRPAAASALLAHQLAALDLLSEGRPWCSRR